MNKVYLVKSFGPENGYLNLKVFATADAAEQFANITAKSFGVKRDTDDDCHHNDEFLEVEELDYVV
jgi:hypothetical protein